MCMEYFEPAGAVKDQNPVPNGWRGKIMNKRESFSSRWGFICACIGSAVGMGNIWMFPTRVSLYGGGSFLIPYFIFVILIGLTGVIGEMSFGRAAKAGQSMHLELPVRKRKEKSRRSTGDDPCIRITCHGDRIYGCNGVDPKICRWNIYRSNTFA